MTRRRSREPRQPPSQEDDDLALWEALKSRLEPLKKGRDRVPTAPTAEPLPPPAVARKSPVAKDRDPDPMPAPVPVRKPPPGRPAAHKTKAGAPLAEIERRKVRKLASGRHDIEAALDLHGMRQRDAHAALTRFLHQAHARKLKFVKVITGKGRKPILDNDHTADLADWMERDRGILRREVPRWLAEPEIRTIVVGFSSAGPGDGGDGALYIELRRKG